MTPRQPPHSRQVPIPSGSRDPRPGKMRGLSTMTVTAHPPLQDSPARALVCRACGARFPLVAQHACHECFGPLEVDYDADAIARVTRAQIEAGPDNIWRYAGLLPTGQDPTTRVTVNPGWTPLVPAGALAAAVGIQA